MTCGLIWIAGKEGTTIPVVEGANDMAGPKETKAAAVPVDRLSRALFRVAVAIA
jgi:hypothetical protein